MNSQFFILVAVCLAGLAGRTSYELLKKAGRVDLESWGIFLAVFAAMSALLAVWPVMCPLDPWAVQLPGAARGSGLALVALALALEIGALVQLQGLENIRHLVTSGLFSKIRHPMYTGFILWILGWSLRYGAAASSIVGLVAIGNILFWRHLEDRALEARYGRAYQDYRQTTWF